jgi:ATP phosphoribosyltransferase
METNFESSQMDTIDCILDLVSNGTTLHENNLKEIDSGAVLSS